MMIAIPMLWVIANYISYLNGWGRPPSAPSAAADLGVEKGGYIRSLLESYFNEAPESGYKDVVSVKEVDSRDIETVVIPNGALESDYRSSDVKGADSSDVKTEVMSKGEVSQSEKVVVVPEEPKIEPVKRSVPVKRII